MGRYWLVPFRDPAQGAGCGPVSFWRRPIAWVLQRLGVSARIHIIIRSDYDRAMHNHPQNFVSLILRGRYIEHTPVYTEGRFRGIATREYRAGNFNFKRRHQLHRLSLLPNEYVVSLFIFWGHRSRWGFAENLRQPHIITDSKHYDRKPAG
jgi:hypothetical protein